MKARNLLFALSLSLIASLGLAQTADTVRAAQQSPVITIGAGDMVDIEIFDVPDMSGTVRVGQNGSVNLPVLGAIHLSGLTAEQAARSVEAELRHRGLVLEPTVTVSIAEYATQGANVMGEVKSPGIYPTLGTRRMMDMLSLAGGVSLSAGKLVTIIHRSDPTHAVAVALAQNAAGLKDQENPIILPGDTVVVAKAGIVYIMGDVGRPGGYLIDNNERVSLMEALTLAGGTNKTAKLSKARLIRKIPDGREEVLVNLDHVYYGQEADASLKDGDIVFVPSSVAKALAYKGVDATSQIAAGLAIYAGTAF